VGRKPVRDHALEVQVALVDALEAQPDVAADHPVLEPGRRLLALARFELVDRLAAIELLVLLLGEETLLAHRLQHLGRSGRRLGHVGRHRAVAARRGREQEECEDEAESPACAQRRSCNTAQKSALIWNWKRGTPASVFSVWNVGKAR